MLSIFSMYSFNKTTRASGSVFSVSEVKFAMSVNRKVISRRSPPIFMSSGSATSRSTTVGDT